LAKPAGNLSKSFKFQGASFSAHRIVEKDKAARFGALHLTQARQLQLSHVLLAQQPATAHRRRTPAKRLFASREFGGGSWRRVVVNAEAAAEAGAQARQAGSIGGLLFRFSAEKKAGNMKKWREI
jgi:hypothetical protein